MLEQALAELESRSGAHEKKQIDEKDCDEDEAADEDVGPESHHGFVPGKVGRRDVFVLVVAFVVVFVHADKLTSQMRCALRGGKIFFCEKELGCDSGVKLNVALIGRLLICELGGRRWP